MLQDKNLRRYLKEQMVSDIKNMNSKSKNVKLNSELQNFFFNMIEDNHAVAIKIALDILKALYKKQVWNDAKTVNIIASACVHKIVKIKVSAIKFFIGSDETNEKGNDSSSDSDDEDLPSLKRVRMAMRVNKKKDVNKRLKKEEKIKFAMAKQKDKKNKKLKFDFSAIHLIHDPQKLAEKLFQGLKKTNERFEVRLMTMNLISRLVGLHELHLPNFYPYLQRYLFVTQRDVTKVMTYAAQSVHSLVSPDDLEPLLRTLADNFVTERYSGEVMAMGINAIRELCARNPYCMNEDLLKDLADYRSHKEKVVALAARSLISQFRELHPEVLAKKDRGAPTELSKEMKVVNFGETKVMDYIPGAEVLTFNTGEANDKESDSDDNDLSDIVDDDSDTEKSSVSRNNTSTSAPVYTKKEAVKEALKMTLEDRVKKAQEIMTTRLLTDEDFHRINTLQATKQVEKYSKAVKKRKLKEMQEQQEEAERRGEIVSLRSIEMVHKKRRHDKEARLQSILEGREGREKFGSRKGRMNPMASTSNKDKGKKKSFQMMKHKIKAGKKKLSFREKQIKLRNALLKAQKFK